MRLLLSSLEFGSSGSGCIGSCEFTSADRQHPNKMPFKGVLVLLDQPSTKPPHGSQGHRIMVPKVTAKRRLSTLIGMALNYAPDLSGHAVRRKVGVITGARIEGNKLWVMGHVWKKDFPEAERDLKAGSLGMSMELSSILVRDVDATVWVLDDFHFSGATALFKSSAAYFATSLVAAIAASAAGSTKSGGGHMAKEKEKVSTVAASAAENKALADSIAAAVGPAVQNAVAAGMETALVGLRSQFARMSASIEEVKALALTSIESRGHEEDDEEAEADAEAAAAKKEDQEDDEGEEDDNDDDEDVEAELEELEHKPAEQEPGEVNKDAKNQGRKTTVTASADDDEEEAAVKASKQTGQVISILRASNEKLRKRLRKLEAKGAKVDALEAQVATYADHVERRSVTPELAGLLAKGNVNVSELMAEGRKLTTTEVDEIIAASGLQLDVVARMNFKNQLFERGLMETGEVVRRRSA